ncbi:DUF3014 domain-containing protein [Hydrocarboniphaga sp.]|uniref:DUF3014 domain-containing protein n=1 Tax=Hydrocarboniphaga sp. TaxID=2033016 RepID=UPI003D14564A
MKARDWALPVIIIVAAVVAAAWYFFAKTAQDAQPSAEVVAPAAVTTPAPPAADDTPQNPVPVTPPPSETAPPAPPLPLLASSDAEMRQSLIGLFDTAPVEAFLIPTDIIRRFVAMIDNLPEASLPMRVRPIRKIDGGFVAQQQAEGSYTLSAGNAARYAGFVEAVQMADAKRVSEVYFRYYPLFQSAYEELGHPGQYFNDRLVQVIDHLLATPEIAGAIPLTRPKVFYQFADPALESLSAGQKALIRIGPENAEVVKAKLRELRARIATHRATAAESP